MADVFVASTGSNTAPYSTWATAATSLATGLAAAVAGDLVLVQYNAVPAVNKEQAADTTYAIPSGVIVLSVSNDGGAAWTYRPMADDSDWIGNSTINRSVRFAVATANGTAALGGFRIRTAGTTSDACGFHVAGQQGTLHIFDPYIDIRNTNGGSPFEVGTTTSGQTTYTFLYNPRLRFGNASQGIQVRSSAVLEIYGGYVDSAGTAPNVLFISSVPSQGVRVEVNGLDASALGTGRTLVGDFTTAPAVFNFRQVRRGEGCAVLAAQSTTNRYGVEVFEYDCQEGSTLGIYGFHNAFGAAVLDRTTYLTANAAQASWRVTTTAACSRLLPFVTPWTDLDNQGVTTASTFRREILRSGSTSPYTSAEVYSEFTVQTTTGSVLPTFATDGVIPGVPGANQAAGAGTSAWTGAAGSLWSGKLETPSSLTPIAGRLRSRVVVTAASQSLFVDTDILAA